MASSIRLIASNLITRSFPPTAVSASRLLSIANGHRSYTTTIKDDFSDQSSLRIVCPETTSLSFSMWNTTLLGEYRLLTLKLPNDGLTVQLKKAQVNMKDMRAWAAEQNNRSDIKEEVKDATLPNEDELKNTNIILQNMANDIITSFCNMTAKRGWSYYDMFYDRSILVKGLCRAIATPLPFNSFTLTKFEDDEGIVIDLSIPGHELEMKLTTRGLCVSFEMFGIRREDVKTFFEYNTFFIEGKANDYHHITGIHLPKGFHMRHNMIKREMMDNVFYAFLSCSGKNAELLEQLKVES